MARFHRRVYFSEELRKEGASELELGKTEGLGGHLHCKSFRTRL